MDLTTNVLENEITETRQNKNLIVCKYCDSVILLQLAAEHIQKTV